MFCKYCGKEVAENTRYCVHCGEMLQENQTNKHRLSKKTLIVVCCIGVIVAVSLVIISVSKITTISKNTSEVSSQDSLLEDDEVKKDKSTVFSEYLSLCGKNVEDLPEGFEEGDVQTMTDTENGTDIEFHSVYKVFEGFSNTTDLYVSYSYYVGYQYYDDGQLIGPNFYCSKDENNIDDIIAELEKIYGSYDERYSYPAQLKYSDSYYSECYQWNNVENQQYGLTLVIRESTYEIYFFSPSREYSEADILELLEQESSGYINKKTEEILKAYNTQMLEYYSTQDFYEELYEAWDELSGKELIWKEEVLESTRVHPLFALAIWTNVLGRPTDQVFLNDISDCVLVKVKVSAEYAGDTGSDEYYILVGYTDEEGWKICSMPKEVIF